MSARRPPAAANAARALQQFIADIPADHPLRDYLTADSLAELKRLTDARPSEPPQPKDILFRMRSTFPEFVYVPSLGDVNESLAVKSLIEGTNEPSEALLASLARAAGLTSQTLLQENDVSRRKDLEVKSELLTKRLREHWSAEDLSLTFSKDGQRLAVWIKSAGSGDPPSRKSKGLAYYLSLFAKLAELASKRNVILLLDDPAIYLHPLAQKRMLPLLDSQPFQNVMATHLPFMIDPDHIERVRVVARPKEDSQVLADWSYAREALLPVWGSLLTYYGARTWLVVEGHNDKRAYQRADKACRARGLTSLPYDLPIVPAGGDQADYLVSELTWDVRCCTVRS